jgi:uncharacterized membrane protein
MHPFDIKEALLARHAQHVVLIHFPIALFIVGVAFDLLALRINKLNLVAAAYCNFAVAAIATLPVVVTGLLAWKLQLEGAKLQGVLLLHLVFAMISTTLIWLVWLIHFRARRSALLALPAYRLPIEIFAVLMVAITGHLGGFLSGVNLPG